MICGEQFFYHQLILDARQGDDEVIFVDNPTIQTMAESLDAISYEIHMGIGSRIKRVYINS